MISGVPKHKPKGIEFVRQQNKSDCGIACVAMLTRQLYETVEELFKSGDRKTSRGGLFPEEMSELLCAFGFRCMPARKLLKKGQALVGIQWLEEGFSGHFIVWDAKRQQFLDPLHGVFDKEELDKCAIIEEIWKVTKSEKPNGKDIKCE